MYPEMQIHHTTYEEARRYNTTSAQPPKAEKKKRRCSSCFSKLFTDNEGPSARPTETRQRKNLRISLLPPHQRDEYLTHHRAISSPQRSETLAKHADTLRRLTAPTAPTSPQTVRAPPKAKLTEKIREYSNGRLPSNRPERERSLPELYNLQRAIKAGILERVVPPSRERTSSERGLLSRSESSQEVSSPPLTPTSIRRKKSTSRLFEGYISTASTKLDDTRKGLSLKVQSPFIGRGHSFIRHKISSGSIESFSCIGLTEEQQRENERAAAAASLKSRNECGQYQRESFSNRGSDTWTKPSSSDGSCRLCKRSGRYSGGLCEYCEIEFRRPETSTTGWEFLSGNQDIKPTPPLKDGKYAFGIRVDENWSCTDQDDEEEPKEAWGIIKICRQPTIVNHNLPMQRSHEAMLVYSQDEDDHRAKWAPGAPEGAFF